ncbi:rhodanese-like domain-containing protein [Euzebya tangerina]|uniref:rhodanese-like domain-containing protein n=1 Tax=Euzebya tangerina TaxID=591198 RepID=UPI000E3212AD|nr:rhodanese-like domain-containing protein [Euzebya tangerina]
MSYHSDVTPDQAFDIIQDDADATIVDVRTQAEWAFVGTPRLDDAAGRYLQIEWNHAGGVRNDAFLDQLQAAGVAKAAPVMFLCRSGARSQAAASAATAAGFERAQNISDGFEGGVDEDGHRGNRAGWKADGLPWVQS